jgi:hypothetical protein
MNRFNLEVAQQPIHGRRKTEKDRRPLAHCPIVRLRIKECRRITDGTMRGHAEWEEGWEEEEIDVSCVIKWRGSVQVDVLVPWNRQTLFALPTFSLPMRRQ